MLVLGVIFSGEHYKALAIVSTISFLRENNNFKYCYYVSDSKSTDFETCVTLVIPGIKFTWVAPPETDFSLYKFPKYAGNYVTYWSLELLDFVDKEDVLVFIDSDTYTRRKLPIEEICSSLKEKKYKLAILSNGTPTLLNQLVKSNNLENIFDDIFSIEEVGIYKPDTKVYDMPINKYQIKKSEIAFLSANTWDVSGGGNYGYNSIWVNRNSNIFDNLDYQPKLEIKNLKNLLPNIKSN